MENETGSRIESMISESFLTEIIDIRRHLHQNPELSFHEHLTSEYIRDLLDKWDIPYEFPFVKTGILAKIKGKKRGGRLALRADMDALPITEASGEEFESLNRGIMHACGHDVHMSALLGAIKILNQMKDLIQGEIICIFQPGEEKLPGGASLMLKEGIFRDARPDLILAQHVLPDMKAGHVGFKEGRYMASSDEIYITVKGKGGHGALRHLLRDPILMASHILLRLQEEINRQAPDGIPTVLSFGKVRADGATNVVPDDVYLEGTFRTMNEEWRERAHALIHRIASEIAIESGGSCDIEIMKGYPVLINHEEITRKARACAVDLLGSDKVEDMDVRMTAEDFAWFTQAVPGMMFRLGVKEPGTRHSYALHTSEFRVDESAIRTGISLLAYLSLELLKTIRG